MNEMKNTTKPVPTLDDGLAGEIAAALAPTEPSPPRARAMRERILAAARGEDNGRLTVRGDEGKWLPHAAGIDIKLLHQDAESRSFLLRFAPGATLAAHAHLGEEVCVMLEGAVTIGDMPLRAGDYQLALPGSEHPPIHSATGGVVFIRKALRGPAAQAPVTA